MTSALAWPLISVLVLPIGWLEYKLFLLRKTQWGIPLGILNLAILYGSWIAAIRDSLNRLTVGANVAVGLGMVMTALILWVVAYPLILPVRGQVLTMPEALVTKGPYRWTRHPMYVGHVMFISGGVFAVGALEVFLVTPVLWIIVMIASRYEEHTRLEPRFGEAFRQYRARTPFLLPLWGWILWGIIYLGVIVRLIIA